jgi:FixJ family two-component response regulator
VIVEAAMERPAIFVIDNDLSFLDGLFGLSQKAGYIVCAFSSAEEFLAAFEVGSPGCIILNTAIPNMSGAGLLSLLRCRGIATPIIFVSEHADVRAVIAAMKSGASDFLVKPVQEHELVAAVADAVEQDSTIRRRLNEKALVADRLKTLSPRQREVMFHVAAGLANKQIASAIGTAEKTVKVHRARMMTKMGVRSVAALVQLVANRG